MAVRPPSLTPNESIQLKLVSILYFDVRQTQPRTFHVAYCTDSCIRLHLFALVARHLGRYNK